MAVCLMAATVGVWATDVDIRLPNGWTVTLSLGHVGPSGSLVSPDVPQATAFRPPSLFSAPLPSGSGARALGLAGAFTAVADDATAASWNPAGLVQLERPEASAVYRLYLEENSFRSDSGDFTVGEDSYRNQNLNYLSAVYPFRAAGRNFVFSLNMQEAYDFSQRFSATSRDDSSSRNRGDEVRTYDNHDNPQVDRYGGEQGGFVWSATVTSYLSTRKTSTLSELLQADLVSELEFEQQGIISAYTPAFAMEIQPGLSVGMALNVYQDSPFPNQDIRSHTRAVYSGSSSSRAQIQDDRVTSGHYDLDFSTTNKTWGLGWTTHTNGVYEPFSESSESRPNSTVRNQGIYDEYNDFRDVNGINLTLGALWTVSRHLTLGASLDLPWTAKAVQKKRIRNTNRTYDRSGERLLGETSSEEVFEKDVEFRFPLSWAAGMVWRWNNRLYSTLDVGQTLWSDFAFQADGEEKINPLDGTPHGENRIDDTWTIRTGLEYLFVLRNTEIPVRGGLAWEQRPTVGSPNEFWTASLGSGISIGKDPGKTIIDFAYAITRGEDVRSTLVAGRDLRSDVTEHQFYLSCIQHF